MREEEKQTSLGSKWQRLVRKRWVFPAIYIASAALLLTGVLWFQTSTNDLVENESDDIQNVTDNNQDYTQNEEAVPVTVTEENFKMPVLDEKTVVIKKQFYDNDASSEEQEAALVFYNNTYYPSTGIDIARENGESFDVIASLSGTVVRAENDSLLGNVIEIEHENGVATFYQSLDEMYVEPGTYVDQGEVLGTAGTSVYNKDAGVHVHFEIRQNNEPVNPIDFFNKSFSSIQEANDQTEVNDEVKENQDQNMPEAEEGNEPTKEPKDEPSDDQKNSDENRQEDASISMTRA